jgi:hypothetical protein
MHSTERGTVEEQVEEQQGGMPADPIGGLRLAAASLHELHESFLAVGFDKEEALMLTSSVLVHLLGGHSA